MSVTRMRRDAMETLYVDSQGICNVESLCGKGYRGLNGEDRQKWSKQGVSKAFKLLTDRVFGRFSCKQSH